MSSSLKIDMELFLQLKGGAQDQRTKTAATATQETSGSHAFLKILLSLSSPTPSVTEEDIDNEDDAMELLGNLKINNFFFFSGIVKVCSGLEILKVLSVFVIGERNHLTHTFH